jgi:Barrel-sandwich domain of CusB or HlyD membrane-fusion/GAF domain
MDAGPLNPAAIVDELVAFQGPPEVFLRRLLLAQCRLGLAEAGAVLRGGEGGRPEVLAVYPEPEQGTTAPVWLAQAAESMAAVVESAQTAVLPVHSTEELYGQNARQHLVVLPLRGGGQVRGISAFVLSHSDTAILDQCRERLELTVTLLSLYEMRLSLQRRQGDLDVFAAAMSVSAAINEHPRFKAASIALCNEVANRWNAERVSLGIQRGAYIKLQAMSQTEQFNRKMQLVQDIESAMEECMDQQVEVIHPAPPDAPFIARAAARLCDKHGPTSLCSLPLRRGDETIGVLTVERPADRPLNLRDAEGLRLTCNLCAALIGNLHDTDRWIGAKLAINAKRAGAALVGPRHTWAKLTAVGVSALILFLVFAKGTYKVDAPFIVEAQQGRVIAAPFDGYIKRVNVLPGDTVTAGQTVLAQMETAELRLRRASLVAEHLRYLKEADLARRENKVVEIQIAQHQADKVAADIDEIDYWLSRADIVPEVSGVVVEGDLKRSEGQAVSKGDMMFEVAQLDDLRARLEVSEDRIADVAEGMTGDLATAAQPGAYLRFEVERIEPMAQVKEQKNVFGVRVRLLEPTDRLKPGMAGVAKIDAGKRSYAWIWTRQAVNWLRMKLWF